MAISLEANVQLTIDAIDNGHDPVVDPGTDKIYVLNTSAKNLGNIIYTVFDKETRFPEASFMVRYGAQHTVVQVLYAPFTSRSQLPEIVDMDIPGMLREEFDPTIIPTQGTIYPTEVPTVIPQPKFIIGT